MEVSIETSMHKWYVKNDFSYVLQFFSLISDGLGSVDDVVGTKGVSVYKRCVVYVVIHEI